MTTVLAYHKVDDRFEFGLTNVRPKAFERQVAAMAAEGYRMLTDPENPGSGKNVCLTFDDGYECFHRNVVPVLSSIGAKAIVFVITDFVGKTNSWDVRLSIKPFKHMSAAEIREVVRLGFEVGSHSRTHRDLTRLGAVSLKSELSDSKNYLEDLTGVEVDAFSFPFGRYNRAAAEAALNAGYRRLFGLGSSSGEGVVPRTPVYSIDSPSSVLRKLEMNRMEILKSDFIHSFANISALLSVRNTRKTA
jgi:peptidoglycan/xylan/chitin deacetylase (PgdA/CDA1 family)